MDRLDRQEDPRAAVRGETDPDPELVVPHGLAGRLEDADARRQVELRMQVPQDEGALVLDPGSLHGRFLPAASGLRFVRVGEIGVDPETDPRPLTWAMTVMSIFGNALKSRVHLDHPDVAPIESFESLLTSTAHVLTVVAEPPA